MPAIHWPEIFRIDRGSSNRFPECVLCMRYNQLGKRQDPGADTWCTSRAAHWMQTRLVDSCGEFDPILTHTFTLKQLEELHKHGPTAIKAEWFEEPSHEQAEEEPGNARHRMDAGAG